MTTLPRPDVTVTHATDPSAPSGSMDVVISRDGKGKSYRVVGDSGPAIVKDAIEKVIGDKYTGEWLPVALVLLLLAMPAFAAEGPATSIDFSPVLQSVIGLCALALTALGSWALHRLAGYLGVSQQSAAISAFDDALTRAVHAGASAAQNEIATKGWDHVDVKNQVVAMGIGYAIEHFAPALKGIGLDPTDPNGATSDYLKAEINRIFPTAMASVAASPVTPPA